MSEYTPTTEAVRERYSMQEPVQDLLAAEFDRWMSAHDEAVAAKARREALEEAAQVPWQVCPPGSAVHGGHPQKIAVAIRALAGGTENETPLTFRANPEVTDDRLAEIFVDNNGGLTGLRAVWRDGCDAGMVGP